MFETTVLATDFQHLLSMEEMHLNTSVSHLPCSFPVSSGEVKGLNDQRQVFLKFFQKKFWPHAKSAALHVVFML